MILLSLPQLSTEPTFPDTSTGRFFREMIAAVNAPEREAVCRFALARLDKDDLLGLGPANNARRLEKLRDQSGGLVVERINQDGTAFMAHTRRDGRVFQFHGYGFDGGKGSFELRRWDPPEARTAGYKWPEKVGNRGVAVHAIEALLDSLARKDRWNGVVIVAKGDEILLHTAHGVADRGFNVPIRKDTRFNLASAGKMFTAALIGGLIDEGKLSLDDKLGKFRPDWPDAAAREKVTIRMLLGHTAGFGGLFDSPNYDRTRRYRNSTDLTDALVGEPLAFEPGKEWRYSNGGFVMLGSIVEKITGKDYMDVARERLFRPLGMTGTGWADGNEPVPGLAPVYDRDILDPLGLEPKRRDSMFPGWRGDAHGGGYSTAIDMFRFMRAIRTHRLVSEPLMKQFATPGLNPGYGLGFSFDPSGPAKAVGHNGHARADASVLWDQDITVIALGNDLSEPTPMVAMQIREFLAKNVKAI